MNFWTILIGLFFISLGVGALFGINIWQYFFPLLLIFLGLSILFQHPWKKNQKQWAGTANQTTTHEDTLDYSLSFTGANIKVESNNFLGGKISTLFAGANIDMRGAKFASKNPVDLELSAMFGEVKIMVPKQWKVEGNMSGVFGGFTNSTVSPDKPQAVLRIKGSAVFGGGEITN